MRIGVLIPDRNDRPRLLENCLRMIKAQTLQPEIIELVNDPPPEFFETITMGEKKLIKNNCDITWRYRIGYDRLRNKGLDYIAFMENDDWYHPTYLETMVKKAKENNLPELVGTSYTTYYHIKLFAYFNMHHKTRSSAMSTLIKPDLKINWCIDWEPYTDMHLWLKCNLTTHVFDMEKYITLGIKHGTGLCGGRSHVDRLHRYSNNDSDLKFLKTIMDEESFNFYTNYFKI